MSKRRTITIRTISDPWWYFTYRWHKWRLERCMRNASIHIDIIQNGLKVEQFRFNTYGLKGLLTKTSSKEYNKSLEEQR